MPILNYTTSVAATRTSTQIQTILAKHGVSRISTIFSEGGDPSGLAFKIGTEYGTREFELPIRVDGVLAAMLSDKKIPRPQCTRAQAEKVAWRIAKVWLESQLALIDANMATLDEVMLPYMVDAGGATFYSMFCARQLALEDGRG